MNNVHNVFALADATLNQIIEDAKIAERVAVTDRLNGEHRREVFKKQVEHDREVRETVARCDERWGKAVKELKEEHRRQIGELNALSMQPQVIVDASKVFIDPSQMKPGKIWYSYPDHSKVIEQLRWLDRYLSSKCYMRSGLARAAVLDAIQALS